MDGKLTSPCGGEWCMQIMSRGWRPTKLWATSTALSNWSSWKHLEFSVLCKWKFLSELKGSSRGPGTLFCVLKTFHVSFSYKVQLPKEIIPTSTVQNTRMTIHNKLSCFFFLFKTCLYKHENTVIVIDLQSDFCCLRIYWQRASSISW